MASLDLNALAVFEAVATRGSFVAAGQALDVPKTTVSRRVAALETQLGTRLLQRTTRSVALTEAGRLLLAHCERIRAEADAAEAAISRLRQIPRGRLVVTAPHLFGLYFLAQALPRFLVAHPEIQVDVRLTEEPVDPVTSGVDVAIRAGSLPPRRFAARALGNLTRRLYAAPAYLARRGLPRRVQDLDRHEVLALRQEERRGRVEWHLTAGRSTHTNSINAVLLANDAAFLVEAALAGLGVAKLPEAIVAEHLAAGRLVPVLPGWSGPSIALAATYASREGLAPKTRAFIDFLGVSFTSTGPAGARVPAAGTPAVGD